MLDGPTFQNRNSFISNMLRKLATVQAASKILDDGLAFTKGAFFSAALPRYAKLPRCTRDLACS